MHERVGMTKQDNAKPDDTADALAIATTYAFSSKLAKLSR
jgi:Holliday junction resolvasome RuvABC endonuclease subunit